MLLTLDPKSNQVSIPVNGFNVATLSMDETGHSSLNITKTLPNVNIESLSNNAVMTDVMMGIAMANDNKRHHLFSDLDPEEPSTVVYLSVPKNTEKHDILLISDHESLWHQTDLFFEGVLENLYKITVEDDIF